MYIKRNKNILIFFLILISVVLLGVHNLEKKHLQIAQLTRVYAEDDEEDDREREEENDEWDDEESTIQQTQSLIAPTITLQPQTYIETKVIDPAFTTDTDGDKLVDAIDPNPLVPQWEFYTDDDGDSVPNAFDKYLNENDFFYQQNVDVNANGILDSFENLP
jgi:hypothetical protein